MRRLLLAALLAFASAAAATQDRYPRQDIRFGLRAGPEAWAALGEALQAKPADPRNPVGVTLSLPKPWATAPDWAALDAAVSAARSAHARLSVSTALPNGPEDEATLSYLATLSTHVGTQSDSLALSLDRSEYPAALQEDPDHLALAVKRLTAALRGSSEATILIGDVTEADLPMMEPLYGRDLRAYVEGYASNAAGPTGEPSEEVVRFLEMHHLGAPLLLHLPKVEKPIAAQVLVLASASRGVTCTDVEAGDVAAVWAGLVALRSTLSARMGPGFSTQATSIEGASGPRIDIGIIDLLDADEMVQGMALVPRVANSSAGEVRIELPTADVTDPRAFPLPDGAQVALGYTADQKKAQTVLRVPWAGRPLLVLFNRLKTGTVGGERIDVGATYKLPVEVILARHQAVQLEQDLFLENYRSEARVDYRFKLPGGVGSLDATFKNTFFFQKGAGARWVQNQLLINGVAWKGKTIPELPIVEPEKVNTLPLMLTLGRDYSYRYIKDEESEGHLCHVVEFIPQPEAKGSLYSGRVWIDRKTYVKVKMSVRQTGLTAPQVSNDETDYYLPFQDSGGKTYHLLSRVVGQQLFSVGGVNFLAEREVRFDAPLINEPSFAEAMGQAEASDKPILEDTQAGLRYLQKQKDGTRKLQMEPDSDKLLAVGGFYYDPSLDYPIPLVGVNYFSWDYKKTKTQVNLFAAGAVNTLTVSKVDLLPRTDGAFNTVLFAIPFDDKLYSGGEELEDQRIKILREVVDFGLGWRFSELNKVKLDLTAKYYRNYRTSETTYLFRLPQDHFDLAAALTYTFAWRGLSLNADYEAHRRTQWEPWGLSGTHEDADLYKDYATWGLAASKSFYLPYFQKIAVGVSWLDGKDLDRFSKYQFTYLGRQSLSGFSGSGVRFDRGGILALGYEFNVANVIRFGMHVDHGRVQPNKEGEEWQDHTGASVQASVAGPWKTYWTLDYAQAIRSDIPAVKGDYTVALVVLKLW